MQSTILEIGDKIEMEHIRSATNRTLAEQKYASQLLDFDGIKTAKISMPILSGKVVPLEVEDEYLLCFFTNAGLYQCKARIVERFLEKNMYVLRIEFVTILKKYQRRKYFRLDCLFQMKHRQITDIEKVLQKRIKEDDFVDANEKEKCKLLMKKIPKEWIEGTVSDISGGGLRFHSNSQWKPKDELQVYLPLSMGSGIIPVNLVLRVIACTRYQESRVIFETRGEFVGVKDRDREVIIKYVFEEQRRRIRKE